MRKLELNKKWLALLIFMTFFHETPFCKNCFFETIDIEIQKEAFIQDDEDFFVMVFFYTFQNQKKILVKTSNKIAFDCSNESSSKYCTKRNNVTYVFGGICPKEMEQYGLKKCMCIDVQDNFSWFDFDLEKNTLYFECNGHTLIRVSKISMEERDSICIQAEEKGVFLCKSSSY